MKYIITATGLTPFIEKHYFAGSGMWSSERSDAVEYPLKSQAEEILSFSSCRNQATVEPVDDAQEQPKD